MKKKYICEKHNSKTHKKVLIADEKKMANDAATSADIGTSKVTRYKQLEKNAPRSLLEE